MTAEHPRALAARITETITSGDFDGFAQLFAPGAVVWHSFTRRAIPINLLAASLRQVKHVMHDLHYRDLRVRTAEGGFVQQHLLCGTLDGESIESPACLIATVEDGLISRLEEYLDRSVARRLLRA